jgi:hypothetical protein
MRQLKNKFSKNGLEYLLLNRTDKAALYQQYSMIDGKKIIQGYEAFIIPVRKPDNKCNYTREVIPPNSDFGMKHKSRCFYKLNSALKYFNEIAKIKVGGKLQSTIYNQVV